MIPRQLFEMKLRGRKDIDLQNEMVMICYFGIDRYLNRIDEAQKSECISKRTAALLRKRAIGLHEEIQRSFGTEITDLMIDSAGSGDIGPITPSFKLEVKHS